MRSPAAFLACLLALGPASAASGPSPVPLSAFGLTPAALERLGFADVEAGLLELKAARWYRGPERERKLAELAAGRDARHDRQGPAAPARARVLSDPALGPKLPELGPEPNLPALYDGDRARGAEGAVAFAEAGGLQPAASARQPLPRQVTAQPARAQVPAPIPASASSGLQPIPASASSGLQSRGAPDELARLIVSRLPGSPAADLAAAGTGAAWAAVDRLLAGYATKARLPKPGWEAEMAGAFRDGFSRRHGSPVDVTVTDDLRFFAHRGLWVGNAVLRRPDGKLEVVLNLPWMETIAQDGAFADARLSRIREAIGALGSRERERILEDALGGRDPQAMTYSLLYRLAGWMQAELFGSAGGDAGAAASRTLESIHADPLWKAIYDGALNAAANVARGLGAGLSHPELGKPDSDAQLWTLVREANAGSAAASAQLEERLAARREMIGYAEYLDLTLEANRAAARSLVAKVPGACRLCGRLAQARDPQGAQAFSRNCLAGEGEAFLLEAARRAGAGDLLAGYRQLLEELIKYPGDRPFGERLGRQRRWLVTLAQADPAAVAALWDSIPGEARPAVAAALASEAGAAARQAYETLGRERPAAATVAAEDKAVAMVLAKASRASSTRLEEAAYGPARAFHAQPQSFVGLLKEPAVVSPLLQGAKASGVEPEYLAAVAFQEGYYLYAQTLAEGRAFGSFDSMEPMGLDSFADLAETLKRKGFLRKDFDGYTLEGTRLNEAGHRLRVARFAGPEAALEAMGALIRHKRAQFEADARGLGLDPGRLSAQDRELWGYVYYNFRNPKAMLSQNGFGWVRRAVGPSHPLYSAQRVAATAAFLRELGLFR